MPTKQAIAKARADKRAGKSPSTQAGEFVKEEIDKIRRGEHGARSARQAVAIGLSEARRAGVDLPPPRKGRAKKATRRKARYERDVGQGRRKAKKRPRVARAVKRVLKSEPRRSASHRARPRPTRQHGRRARGAARWRRRRPPGRGPGIADKNNATSPAGDGDALAGLALA